MNAASEAQARRVARYYRWLDGLSFFRERRAEGEAAHPVHRALTDPNGGPPSPLVVHRLMLEGVALPEGFRALDAGCGYGATMLDLAPKLGGVWLGLTLSPEQGARGMAAVRAAGLEGRVRIEVASYDAPPPGPFHLIYGIESLIHSADPAATISGLAATLAPGGWLVVVDDMPVEAMPDEARRRLEGFRRFWRCPVAPSRAGWRTALEAAGLSVQHERDLSPLLRVRSMEQAAPRLREITWKQRLLGPLAVRLEAEIGGIFLETLQTEGLVEYRVMAARKPG
ncbi:SAM-dependent methyltransferase [Roseococcus sp. DSY-14]|uniref:SAM-dependent methyltransferase n=1 Tax=Roseococcus sp. DSY-14 TaxID=3369650 RepID=UPI00387B5FF2